MAITVVEEDVDDNTGVNQCNHDQHTIHEQTTILSPVYSIWILSLSLYSLSHVTCGFPVKVVKGLEGQ